MSFSKVYSAQSTLLEAHRIDVEVDISQGLHTFTIVGLADKAIDESRSRVSAAIKNSGFKPPKQKNEKIVISLAPAHIKKNGPIFDVSIALSYLKASKDISFDATDKIFLGELALDGKLRPVSGILPLVRFAKNSGFKEVFIPKENVAEAAIISGINIYGAVSLGQIIDHIHQPKISPIDRGEKPLPKIKVEERTKIKDTENILIDLAEIRGQEHAKRGIQIAASGGHNICLYGPPGTGKTMLAKAFSGILPRLSFEEILDVTSIHSVAGILKNDLVTNPPLRSPHHTSSYVSLFGGGRNIKPGEITLAHRGILFLDEFPEFEKRVIEGLRQPLEDGEITISRAEGSARYPANFILIATMNPCPCGFSGSGVKDCTCSPQNIERYKQKVSGPIMDRIDMWIEVGQIEHKRLLEKSGTESESKRVCQIVQKSRDVQMARSGKLNGELSPKEIERNINLGPKIKELLLKAAKKLNLSARSYHKIIKLSRTIADLDNSKEIEEKHLLEALQYRPKI